MPVNPDEMLIFKMRGMKTTQAVQPQPAAKVEAAKPAPVKPASQVQAKAAPQEKTKLFAQTPTQIQQVSQPEAIPLEELEEEEKKMNELRKLEEQAEIYKRPEGLEAMISEERVGRSVTVVSVFSRLSGAFFILTALVLGYSIYPQSAFVVEYLVKTGVSSLWVSWNANYAIALINTILAIFSGIGGLLMLNGVKKSHLMCGFTGAAMLLMTSFEYLNSNATYTLLVSLMAFVSIVTLAYARMSAVVVMEREYPSNVEISWPRMESF